MDDTELKVRIGAAHLLATYQYLADSGKTRQLAALFAPDGVLEVAGAAYRGPDGVLGFFQNTKNAFMAADILPARHHLSSIYIDPRPDGCAHTYACFQFIGTRGLDHWGVYRDVVLPDHVAGAGGWRFAHRRVEVEGCSPNSAAAAMLGVNP